MTAPFNIANRCPLLTASSGMAASGIRTGVQVVGHSFDDAEVFTVGAAVKAVLPRAALTRHARGGLTGPSGGRSGG